MKYRTNIQAAYITAAFILNSSLTHAATLFVQTEASSSHGIPQSSYNQISSDNSTSTQPRELLVHNGLVVAEQFGGDWVATALDSSHHIALQNLDNSAFSSAQLDGYSGESSFYAKASSTGPGASASAESRLAYELSFEALDTPTQFYIDVNLEGTTVTQGVSYARFTKDYKIWHRGGKSIPDSVFLDWKIESSGPFSSTDRLFFDLESGTTGLGLMFNERLTASAGHWGAGEVFADFSSTSWLNFGFTSDIAYTIDEPALFSTPRANLVSPVPEPSAIALGLAGACVVLFAARRQKRQATEQNILTI